MVYNEKNIKLLYFSPYVKIKENGNKIVFYNYIFETTIIIENIEGMIESIKNGIELENLIILINENFEEKETKEKGCYVYSKSKLNKNLIMSSDGTNMIVDNTLLNKLKKNKLDEDFLLKLIQRGFVEYKNSRKIISTYDIGKPA